MCALIVQHLFNEHTGWDLIVNGPTSDAHKCVLHSGQMLTSYLFIAKGDHSSEDDDISFGKFALTSYQKPNRVLSLQLLQETKTRWSTIVPGSVARRLKTNLMLNAF